MRRRIDFHADPCRRFVHDVDSLIGQVAVGNIAGRQFDGSPYGFIGDTGLVEGFVAIAQAEEDGYGVVFIRFTDLDGLETPSQGGIFFKVLLIFVSRRRSDALQIAASQGRFQDIGRIHSAFYGTGADELMNFIDEEDDRIVAGNGIQDAFDPFFEFTAVLGTGDDAGEVQGKDALVLQAVRDVAGNDTLCQPFGNGSLTDAGSADEDRIVLRPAA